mmetsp:Transcript_11587/g.21542  ORF Transcript_11587/g.21542 Transcript_11587/m.21542 type:complete len:117 (-) Transcript_11587:232-582(-)
MPKRVTAKRTKKIQQLGKSNGPHILVEARSTTEHILLKHQFEQLLCTREARQSECSQAPVILQKQYQGDQRNTSPTTGVSLKLENESPDSTSRAKSPRTTTHAATTEVEKLRTDSC